jgi:hypothetical protein
MHNNRQLYTIIHTNDAYTPLRGRTEAIKLLLSYGATVEDSTQLGIFEGKTCLG